MQITEFKRIGKSTRIKIYVDGSFYATLIDETIALNNLRLNTEYSEDYLKKVVFEGQSRLALDAGFTLLSKNFKTEKEFREYLKGKGYVSEAINFAVERLKEYNYINDENYAKNYVQYKQTQKGKKALAFELKQKGVASEIIENVLADIESAEDTIQKLAEKFLRSKNLDDPKLREKLFRHLASKGFDFEEIKIVINKVL